MAGTWGWDAGDHLAVHPSCKSPLGFSNLHPEPPTLPPAASSAEASVSLALNILLPTLLGLCHHSARVATVPLLNAAPELKALPTPLTVST